MAGWVLIPIVYQLLVIAAWVRFRRQRPAPEPDTWPPVTVLKPTAAGDSVPVAALQSHLAQDYPQFEIRHDRDPGLAAPNRKVGKLQHLTQGQTHPVWIVNDADIRVPPGYLRRVVATLCQPGVGLVTCLYHAVGDTMASRWEAFGVAVDFMPSVMVARLVGVREFGLGATLAFRRSDLERAGGWESIAPYLADDYQLAARITRLGLRVELAPVWVETSLHGDWRAVWRHQVRWARTIRVSKGWGYAGLPVTHAGIWAAVAALTGEPAAALGILAVRMFAAATASRWFLLSPLWDGFAFLVWMAGLFGDAVEWGGRRLRLDSAGRIQREPQFPPQT